LFIGVSDMLKISTNRTVGLLKSELEIQLSELEEQWHFLSLEYLLKIKSIVTLRKRTTRVIQAVDDGLKPHIKHLKRAITEEDILRLLDIRIMRISKFEQ
jgi:topoisomerase-4 subunit A